MPTISGSSNIESKCGLQCGMTKTGIAGKGSLVLRNHYKFYQYAYWSSTSGSLRSYDSLRSIKEDSGEHYIQLILKSVTY